MNITKDTQLCISISTYPGNFGSNIFNQLFQTLSLNFLYKPCQVLPQNLSHAIDGIRSLKIRGCGVSMPHKTVVLKYLDRIDEMAKKIGAVNTIVNREGILTGYNTDIIGIEKAINKYFPVKQKKAHIIGSGGIARAAIIALKNSQCKEITISSRNNTKTKSLATTFNINYCSSKFSNEISADILINATPVGMSSTNDQMIIKESDLDNYNTVMDVVLEPLHTKLIEVAKKERK